MKRLIYLFLGMCTFAWILAGISYGYSSVLSESWYSMADEGLSQTELRKLNEQIEHEQAVIRVMAISVGEAGSLLALFTCFVVAMVQTKSSYPATSQPIRTTPSSD